MLDYKCPGCGKKLLQASAIVPVLLRTHCRRCKAIVVPEPRSQRQQQQPVLHRTYRCSRCKREQHVERPVNHRPPFCVVCGTQSLVVVAETAAPNTAGRREAVTARA